MVKLLLTSVTYTSDTAQHIILWKICAYANFASAPKLSAELGLVEYSGKRQFGVDSFDLEPWTLALMPRFNFGDAFDRYSLPDNDQAEGWLLQQAVAGTSPKSQFDTIHLKLVPLE